MYGTVLSVILFLFTFVFVPFHCRCVQIEHSGELICKLRNDSGEVICKARLSVKEDVTKRGDRPLFLERPSDTEVNEGGEVTFECVISGVPEPEVTWYFNGREVHVSDAFDS